MSPVSPFLAHRPGRPSPARPSAEIARRAADAAFAPLAYWQAPGRTPDRAEVGPVPAPVPAPRAAGPRVLDQMFAYFD